MHKIHLISAHIDVIIKLLLINNSVKRTVSGDFNHTQTHRIDYAHTHALKAVDVYQRYMHRRGSSGVLLFLKHPKL